MTIADIRDLLPKEGDTDWGNKINLVIIGLADSVAAITGMSNPIAECDHCGRCGIVGHSCWSCGASVKMQKEEAWENLPRAYVTLPGSEPLGISLPLSLRPPRPSQTGWK